MIGIRQGIALLAVAATTAGLAACGSDEDTNAATSAVERPTITVLAAASLTEALTACAKEYQPAQVRLSFGGSDELAAQLRRGIKADLLAAANRKIPEQLAGEGLVEAPREFARNELVLAVPANDAKVASLDDLIRDEDAKLAIGSDSVPVGSYTRATLDRLPEADRKAVLARVRTEEPDVKSVLAKLQRGAVDAAFVYRTDAKATGGDVEAVTLPGDLQPEVAYDAAVVTEGQQQPAEALLEDLRGGACGKALQRAGFLAPSS